MSTYRNTLSAYAGKLKAQRKAQQRLALAQARAKSAEQKLADKMRIEAERLLKQEEASKSETPTKLVEVYLDLVARKFRTELNEFLVNGERAQITRDLCKVAELYFYKGPIPGNVAYKLIDATGYSRIAFSMFVSVLVNMKLVEPGNAPDILNGKLRTVVALRSTKSTAVSFANDASSDIELIKQRFIENDREGKTGVFYHDPMELRLL